MQRFVTLLASCGLVVLIKASEPYLLDLTIEDLGQIPLNTSLVSNRYEINIDKASSSVTLVTEDEIKRHGYKTLQELLNHVVGFDEAYHIFRTLVSNRGFRQDINSNYLLLIDGHRINEDAYGGFGDAHIFPMMSNIASVEIIRGPSSTLWGSSAINGIIAITTKDASDYVGSSEDAGALELSFDYEVENRRHITQFNYAKEGDGFEWLLSGQYFDNDAPWSSLYAYGTTELTPYKKPQAQYDYEPSYKLYSKMRVEDITLLVSKTHYKNIPNNVTYTYPTRTTTDEEALTDRFWIDLLYAPQISDHVSLESRLFYDDKVYGYVSYTTEGEIYSKHEYIDRGVGAEAIVHYTVPAYHLLGGIYAHRKHLESRYQEIELTDKNLALFGEYTYQGVDGWLFTLGGRTEYGSPRGDTHSFMPRASIFWQVEENWFLKYAYNTGALRPTLITLRDYYYTSGENTYYAKGADSSQTSRSHDLQIGYRGNSFEATVTLFYSEIDDLVLWGDQYQVGTTPEGVPIVL